MTAAELLLYQRVQRRAAVMTPDLAAAVLRAFAALRDTMSEAELARLITLGGPDRVVAALLEQAVQDVALAPVRDRVRYGVLDAVRSYTRALPVPAATARSLALAFDFLSPHVITAIRALEAPVLTRLVDEVRETVRAHVEQGLREGVNPREVARTLRPLIGLGETQRQQVENFRAALEGKDGRNALDYAARDHRLDAAIKRMRAGDAPIPPARIEKAVADYTKRRIALNAEATARTAALQAQKLAQRLAFENAAARGIIDRRRLMRRWIGVMDTRERPEHVAMEGAVARFDEPFLPINQMIPGEGEYNCRCLARYYVA